MILALYVNLPPTQTAQPPTLPPTIPKLICFHALLHTTQPRHYNHIHTISRHTKDQALSAIHCTKHGRHSRRPDVQVPPGNLPGKPDLCLSVSSILWAMPLVCHCSVCCVCTTVDVHTSRMRGFIDENDVYYWRGGFLSSNSS